MTTFNTRTELILCHQAQEEQHYSNTLRAYISKRINAFDGIYKKKVGVLPGSNDS